MRTPKQILCNHKWEFLAENTIDNEMLEQCVKCKVYKVWHGGINGEYKTREFPTNKGWEVTK